MALPIMALLTTALLFLGQAVIEHAEATLDGGEGKGDLEVAWLDRTLPLALQTYAGSMSLRKLEPESQPQPQPRPERQPQPQPQA